MERRHLGEREFLERRAEEARRLAREAEQAQAREVCLAQRRARATEQEVDNVRAAEEQQQRASKRRKETLPTRST